MHIRGIARQLTILCSIVATVAVGVFGGMVYLMHQSSRSNATRLSEVSARNHDLLDVVGAVGKIQSGVQALVREKDPDRIEELLKENEAFSKDAQAKLEQSSTAGGEQMDALQCSSKPIRKLLTRSSLEIMHPRSRNCWKNPTRHSIIC